MSETWWYLSRSSGVVATVLIVLALVWGFFFAARATGDRRPAKWWLDLHRYFGGLAFVFTLVHLVAVYQDRLSGIGLLQILVPMTATGWAWGITWGVVATYVFAALVFTSWPKRRLSRRAWRAVHLLSVPGTIMVAAHAWLVGSSAGSVWFQGLLALLTGLAVYPLVLRLVAVVTRRRRPRPGSQAVGRRPASPGGGSARPAVWPESSSARPCRPERVEAT